MLSLLRGLHMSESVPEREPPPTDEPVPTFEPDPDLMETFKKSDDLDGLETR
jgi:hypothetical protein